MLQYWSSWNFSWWLASEIGLCSMNGPLKTSILYTSIIGAYITYIYPRKIVINRYKIPYSFCILLDLIGHQLPLVRVLQNNEKNNKLCGVYVIIPVTMYSFLNYYRNINVNKIYGINMIKIYLTSIFIGSSYGYLHHYKKINDVGLHKFIKN